MSIFSRIFGRSTAQAQVRTVDLENYFLPMQTLGGKNIIVTTKKSASLGIVFECVDVIKRTLSLVSPKIYEQRPDGKYPAPQHPLYTLVNTEPYTLYTATDYYGQMIADYLLYGNAYAIIQRNGGRVTGLRRLEPENVEPYLMTIDGVEERWYKITDEKEKRSTVLNQRDMIHLMDFNFDGIKGLSRIQLKKNTITEAGQVQIYATDMYKSGVSVSGYLESDRMIGKDELDYLRRKFEQQTTAANGGIAALPQGFKYNPLKYNLPFADAEIIEAQKWGVENVARIFGVPLSLIGRSDMADNKADAEFNRFLSVTIAPLTILLENEHNRKLFSQNERWRYYIKFNLKGLFRVDMLTRYQAHQIALSHGFMNKDEVRDVEGMNPIPGGMGQVYFQMLNTIPLDQAMEYHEYKDMNGNDLSNDNDDDNNDT
jgi:HK97 family phage portal protein